jgi:BspA type Leucine rich repeat region (6 copies)
MSRRRRWGRTPRQNHFTMDVWGIWRLNSDVRQAMKTKRNLIHICLLAALPMAVQAQLSFTTNSGAITITGYNTNAGPNVAIPAATNGYPVTSIGDDAFENSTITSVIIPNSVTNIGYQAFLFCFSLTGVIIPNTVTSIGDEAFYDSYKLTSVIIGTNVTDIGSEAFSLTSLTRVTIPNSVTSLGDYAFNQCASLTNVAIGNGVTSIGDDAFEQCGLTRVTIPNNVTNIGDYAFNYCTNLTKVTIGANVTSIGSYAFNNCQALTGVYFQGNSPTPTNDMSVFGKSGIFFTVFDTNAITYYLPGATGWGAIFDGIPVVLWNPQAQTSDGSFGVLTNQFGFNITGSSNLVIVVEACTNLANPIWSPVSTNTLNTFIGTNGISYFSDPQWTNYPCRFYGFSWP